MLSVRVDVRLAQGRGFQVTEPNDKTLIIRVARGEREALAQLYDRYGSLMLALGVRILKDRSEAEELLHDVFLEAWKRAGDYDPARGTVRTWLTLRMRSRCLDRVKSAGRSRTRPAGEALEALSGTVAARAEAQADASRVHEALAALPAEQRHILELGYFRGLSCSEMAGELEIPIGTVKSRLHAAMKKLRVAFSAGSHEAGVNR